MLLYGFQVWSPQMCAKNFPKFSGSSCLVHMAEILRVYTKIIYSNLLTVIVMDIFSEKLLQITSKGFTSRTVIIVSSLFPDGNYMFKVNDRNARTKCGICSKLTTCNCRLSITLLRLIFTEISKKPRIYFLF